jgi:hypothetical protein
MTPNLSVSGDPTKAELGKLATARLALAEARAEHEALSRQTAVARARIAAAEADLAALPTQGPNAARIKAATELLRARLGELATIDGRRLQVDTDLSRIRGRIDELDLSKLDPASALSSGVPIALLPIRLETRFVGNELRIRVYPDVIHIDQLEQLLTADEVAYGQQFWRERWTASGADVTACWDRFVSSHLPQRLAWIVDRTTPTNITSLGTGQPAFAELAARPPGPSRAPTATLLPGRWVAVGLRAGSEVFRVWSQFVTEPLAVGVAPVDPTTVTVGAPPDVQDELAMDEASRWLVDYDRAFHSGMAITVRATDVTGRLKDGVDRLVVVGVDHRTDPVAAANQLEDLLRAHHATDGLGFIPAGTPTNAGADDIVPPRPVAGDPTVAPPALSPSSSATTAASALGLSGNGVLARLVGAERDHDPLAQSMLTVLWEPTLGYFLHQMMAPAVSEPRITQVRDHFRAHVRSRGPLPLLRVGNQPLGMLPVVALARYTGDAAETFLADTLRAVRPLWASSAESALQLGVSGDPAADLVRLLERTDRSVAHRIREAFGAVTLANTDGAQPLAQMQQAVAQLVLAIAGLTDRPRIVDITLDEDQFVAQIPLVTGVALSATAALEPDYIARVRSRLSARNGYILLRQDPEDASTLLEALLIHAGDLELARASMNLLVEHLDIAISTDVALADPEFVPDHFEAHPDRAQAKVELMDPGSRTARLTISAAQVADQRVASISGAMTFGNYLGERTPKDLMKTPTTRQMGEFRDALADLSGRPTAELHRSATDALDVVSHRYDAWVTSLATRRLASLRSTTATGVHLGAFGWVDDLKPASGRASAGFIHAPSIPQATTAAILRSGHLGRTDANSEALAIDLTSRRVRDANKLLEGMRAGQPLAALLGYQYERGLRDRDAELAQYILPSRQAFPLPGSGDRDEGGPPTEAIAARNVVDGVALAELDAAARQAFLTTITVTSAHRDAVIAELDNLATHLDAVADLFVSEGVFQAVVGNSDRAAAALDALDRQRPIPEIGVGKTQRSSIGIGHRLLVVLDDDHPPASWNGLTDIRGNAEPRVNAWVARVLGDPERFQFGADVLDANGDVTSTLSADLRALGMSPLAAVMSAAHGSEHGSEFDERLTAVFAADAGTDAAALRAHAGPAPKATMGTAGLAEFLTVAHGITDLLGSARAAVVVDLAHPTQRYDPVPDVTELAERADSVAAEVVAIAETTDRIESLDTAEVLQLLRRGADLGMRGALPRSDDRAQLDGQLHNIVTAARTTRDRLASLDASLVATPAPTDHFVAAHHESRLRAVLGEHIPVVPQLVLPPDLRTSINASLSDPALLGSRRAAASEWVLQHARVRPSVERLWSVLCTSEARGMSVDASQLAVAQLPVRAGDAWVGRTDAFDASTPIPTIADTSFVIHRTDVASGALGSSIAALVIDQWYEQIPGATATTGVSFHFDGPGARAPQTMLVAVHPDLTAKQWSIDMVIDTVNETADLARMRTLDLDDVSGAGRFLPAAYLAFNIEREVPTVDFLKLVNNSVNHWKIAGN